MCYLRSLVEEVAVQPIAPPDVAIRVPGSKSLTNRAMVCAALASGRSTLAGWLRSDDTEAMRDGLARLGVESHEDGDDLEIAGVGARFAIPLHPLDCRSSGTTMRFLTALATLAPGRVVLEGSPRLRERPIQELVDALSSIGVGARTTAGFLPVTIYGGGLRGAQRLFFFRHFATLIFLDVCDQQHIGAVAVEFEPVGDIFAQNRRRKRPE